MGQRPFAPLLVVNIKPQEVPPQKGDLLFLQVASMLIKAER